MTGRQRNGVQWWARTIAVLALVALPISAAAGMDTGNGSRVSVIVQERQGAGDGPELAVARLGGTVEREIELIHGFSAQVPVSTIAVLRTTAGVSSVTEDRRVRLTAVTPQEGDSLDAWATTPAQAARRSAHRRRAASADGTKDGTLDGWDPTGDDGSMYETLKVTGASRFWRSGYTGQGVDVALIDSGVAPVEGVTRPGKLVYGPDLSFESQDENLRHLDTFGHGTHMAGIIGGYDADATSPPRVNDDRHFLGMAPGSRLISLKVADRGGAADVSQVIAAIDWVVQHRNTDGLNIRVINLSFGTDGVQDYRIDPLAYAAEAAWRKGIVVVVAAGNAGFGSEKLNNPAYDPYVIAVGASDPKGTRWTMDDDVSSFSSSGDGTRNPDLVAPGKSIVSLRVPGSGIDVLNPQGRVGTTRFFRGSGTSQAAAVVSGAVALLLQQRPDLQPDQVKSILKASSIDIKNSGPKEQGAGGLSMRRAYAWHTPSLESVTQRWEVSTGTGSLDAARGSERLEKDGVTLDGERDIFGTPWDGRSWSADLWNGSSWSGGVWRGNAWTGSDWTGSSWSGSSWSGRSWSASAWTGSSWSGSSWSGSSWSGSGWTGRSWSASAWTGSSWSGSTWTGTGWASAGWGR